MNSVMTVYLQLVRYINEIYYINYQIYFYISQHRSDSL